MEFTNSFQYTGLITLVLNTNLRHREREYNATIPRNIVTGQGNTDIDILSTVNQDSTRLFKERLRDKYLTTKLTYSGVNGISVPYIKFDYRISNR
jgi:hypothetical protein